MLSKVTTRYKNHTSPGSAEEPLEDKIPDNLNPVEDLKIRALCRIADNLTRIWLDQEKSL